MQDYITIKFVNNELILIDQRLLPHEESFVVCKTLEDGYIAIKDMVVRGAPCIGFTAIYSMALWIKNNPDFKLDELKKAASYLKSARPTAVNLTYEADRVVAIVESLTGDDAYQKIVSFGDEQLELSESRNRSMATIAEKELDKSIGKSKYRILTHCNTGFLACGSIGTALGVVQQLHENSKLEKAWVDETRPYLQGSRLTAYELTKIGADHEIVVEGAASYLMKNGLVDAIFTGADRIVANGDTANKIGTSNLAIIASHYKIPFFIVAPTSTFDMESHSGKEIEVEMRPQEEILKFKDIPIAPTHSKAFNPSFDITDGALITGIISEKGIALGNYPETLKEIS